MAKNKLAERLLRSSQSKKQEENSASPILRSRIDHLVRVTPELVLRKRGRAVEAGEEEEEQDTRAAKQQKMDSLQAQMAQMLEGMAELKKNVATKDDIRGVNSKLKAIEAEQKAFDDRLTKIERDKANTNIPRFNGPRPRPLPADRELTNSSEFRTARRSLYISPAEPSLAGVKKFLSNNMGIPSEVVEDLKLDNIRSIHPKKLPAHRRAQCDSRKVHLSLRDSYERDLILSYTSNLVSPDRLDVVIPEYLLSMKAKLEGLAYKIRKHAREANDRKVMTSLRLDDKTEGLVMAVREEKDDP